MMESEHGIYKDITDEKEVMDITTKAKHCVIHFYHSDFRRCMIVDKHLEVIDERHHEKICIGYFFKVELNSCYFVFRWCRHWPRSISRQNSSRSRLRMPPSWWKSSRSRSSPASSPSQTAWQLTGKLQCISPHRWCMELMWNIDAYFHTILLLTL